MLLRSLGVLNSIQIRGARLSRQPLGKEKIAGKSVGSLNNLVFLAGSLDILEQNDFHSCILLKTYCSSCVRGSNGFGLSSSIFSRRWTTSNV